jgi:two-component system phosphate regulon sensor histidine kinase PhoR
LILLNLIVLIGVWFVFSSIKKEVRLAQLKSDFVSNVSHEIRTPLSLIRMFAETLEMHRVKSEEKKDEYYRIIRKETERLTGIVNSILNLSKMESSSRKYNFVKNSLNNIVDEVINTYQHKMIDENCIDFKKDNIPETKLDKEAVTEALINLIDNAVKYSGDNCKITLITGQVDNQIYIDVIDNGIGISKENQKKIFEKFYRVSSGNVHNTQGSGLGLSLVKHIMDAHNGSITVNSKLDEGSTFRLSFPLK